MLITIFLVIFTIFVMLRIIFFELVNDVGWVFQHLVKHILLQLLLIYLLSFVRAFIAQVIITEVTPMERQLEVIWIELLAFSVTSVSWAGRLMDKLHFVEVSAVHVIVIAVPFWIEFQNFCVVNDGVNPCAYDWHTFRLLRNGLRIEFRVLRVFLQLFQHLIIDHVNRECFQLLYKLRRITQ